MITLSEHDNVVKASVFGTFQLADAKALEAHIHHAALFNGAVAVLVDLSDMVDYTIYVAWEEIRFSRTEGQTLTKVAIVTQSQWQTWVSWLMNAVLAAEVDVFADYAAAEAWIEGRV